MNRRLWIVEKLCWLGVLVCGGMLAKEYFYPAEVVFPKVVDAGELEVGEHVNVRMRVTNRTGEEVRILGGNFG
jgi:hypothetical protein